MKYQEGAGKETIMLAVLCKAPFTRYNLLSKGRQNGCTTRFDNRLNDQLLFVQDVNQYVCLNDTAGYQTGCTTGLTTGCVV